MERTEKYVTIQIPVEENEEKELKSIMHKFTVTAIKDHIERCKQN